MKRLTTDNLNAFVRDSEFAVLMFGAPVGEATMDQAIEFADAWAEHRSEADFGYVDAFEHVALARSLRVRVLPTILVFHRNHEIARLEGRHTAARIASAISAPTDCPVAA